MDKSIFPRIASCTTTKDAWKALKDGYQGSNQVKQVRIQTLKRDFENLKMNDEDKVANYYVRVQTYVMEVPTKEGMKKVNHVYFIPKLQHNLLSIGQIMENNYKLVFDDGKCVIYDKNRGNKVVTIVPMSENKLFPLKFGNQGAALANVSIENKS